MANNLSLSQIKPFIKCTQKTIELGLMPEQLELITLLTCERSSYNQVQDQKERLRWRRNCLEIAMGNRGLFINPEKEFTKITRKLYMESTAERNPIVMNLSTLGGAIERAESCAFGQLQLRSLRLLNVLVFLLGAVLVSAVVNEML